MLLAPPECWQQLRLQQAWCTWRLEKVFDVCRFGTRCEASFSALHFSQRGRLSARSVLAQVREAAELYEEILNDDTLCWQVRARTQAA